MMRNTVGGGMRVRSKGRWGLRVQCPPVLGLIAALGAMLFLPAAPARGSAFTVNSTGDSPDANPGDGICQTATPGECTLRAAIQEANAFAGADTITFNIPGPGTHTIAPASALPSITERVIIDGYTQPGAMPNTNPVGSATSSVLVIEIDGTSAGPAATGLHITAGNSTVRGLVINRFSFVAGILLETGGANVIEGNFLGLNTSGASGLGITCSGVHILGSNNNTVGGTGAAARNVISSTTCAGVLIHSGTGNAVQGNYIGTNAAGTVALSTAGGPANLVGVDIESSNNVVGGTTAGARNVIAGNGYGILINFGATGNSVQGNLIGTAADGASPLGNISHGVLIQGGDSNTVGGTAAGAGNTIAYNGAFDGGAGVFVTAGTGNAILMNSIFANSGLGIDLSPAGVTPNDAGDGDVGPNNLQNFPLLTSATSGSTTVQGSLNSAANTTFRIEFFSNVACDPSGNGEGQTFLGFASVTTDGGGNVSFNETLGPTTAVGAFVTATATDPNKNTSEFSACVQVTAAPTATPTATPTQTRTATPTPTVTLTPTETPTPTGTATPPETATVTLTSTLTATPTNTPTATVGPASPAQLAQSLIDLVRSMGLPAGLERSLLAKLSEALRALSDGNPANDVAACGTLEAFSNDAAARQHAGQLSGQQVAQLTAAAQAIKLALGCG